jgi:hypothetical protein
MKKLVLVLVLVFALAIPALANPFVDVPLNHWAYDAVQTLAAKGVIVGYPDGTFGGQRTLTRYEMAEALAKALAYVEQYGGLKEDVEILSKLSVEFADELANLGVKVADLEATVGEHSEAVAAMQEVVDKHERFFEPVTISGTFAVDYEKEIIPLGVATLTDSTDLKFSVEINDTTTAGIDLEIEDVLSENATIDVDGGDFWLKHFGEDLSLWIGEVEPATIGLGLVYDFDVNEEFYGAWAQWMWDTDDEDLGTWTMFMDVDDFYVANVAFDLGDDDDVPMGITASYDPLAGGFVGGADIKFNLTDEDDDDQASLALEAAAFSDLATTSFGVAAQLAGVFGDDDDLDVTVDAWYTQPGFIPTNSDYDADELGVELDVIFPLTDPDDDDVQIAANPYWHYDMDAAMAAAKDHYIGLELDFTNIDSDHPEEEAYVLAEYSLLTSEIYLEGEYLNLVLGEDDDELSEFVFNAYGDINVTTMNYTAVANFMYKFEDEPMELWVEGRADSDGAAPYSAEAQLKYNLDTNTDLNVGVEMNDWEDDINDWDDKVINDNVTKVYAGIEVSF